MLKRSKIVSMAAISHMLETVVSLSNMVSFHALK